VSAIVLGKRILTDPADIEVPSLEFLSLRFDLIDQAGAIEALRAFSRRGGFSYLITPNVDHLVRLHDDKSNEQVWQSYALADLCVCDSRVLQLLARPFGIRLSVLPGSDLTERLLDIGHDAFDDITVIGGNADQIARLERRYPEIVWRAHFPPMGVISNPAAQEEIACFVEASPSTLVIFAIGAPQSELCCQLIARRGKARSVAICTGASLEFLAGLKVRAPHWMQRARLEWLHRLFGEPRRLWRRYLVKGPKILWIILREQILTRRATR
jgi:exopolysaccharide biosynthesis WecB/TagA/CpsF family protein